MTNITPIRNVVLVLPESSPDKKGSLILPEDEAYHPQKGKVLAVGPDVLYLEGGETIYFSKELADEIEVEGTKYVLVEEADVHVREEAEDVN